MFKRTQIKAAFPAPPEACGMDRFAVKRGPGESPGGEPASKAAKGSAGAEASAEAEKEANAQKAKELFGSLDGF